MSLSYHCIDKTPTAYSPLVVKQLKYALRKQRGNEILKQFVRSRMESLRISSMLQSKMNFRGLIRWIPVKKGLFTIAKSTDGELHPRDHRSKKKELALALTLLKHAGANKRLILYTNRFAGCNRYRVWYAKRPNGIHEPVEYQERGYDRCLDSNYREIVADRTVL